VNILIVTGIFPPDIGGPATYVPEVARELAQRGHEITVITTSEPEHLQSDDGHYPFRVLRRNRRTNLWFRSLYFVRTLRTHLTRNDVVFCNGMFLETTIANFFARRPFVQKIVGDPAWERARNRGWTQDGFERFQKGHHDLKLELLKKLRVLRARQADRIIVPSRYLSNCVAEWGIPNEKITIIPNGVKTDSRIVPAHIPLKTTKKIITVGRFVSLKCIDGVIEAISGIDDVGLVICGDGPERTTLQELARRLGLVDRIYFSGQKNRSETLALMVACDVFVLNSIHEGFPHAILEAMMVGLPVVATQVGGTPELIHQGETGFLINPRDVESLRSTLIVLLNSPDTLQKVIEKAKHLVSEFSFARMVDETERVLQQCAGRS